MPNAFMKLSVLAALAAAAACRSDPIREIAAPAPAGALECSRRVLAGLGYAVDGGDADGGGGARIGPARDQGGLFSA